MKIKKIDIAKLNPAEYNPRIELKSEHGTYQKIKRSIQQFGYINPVIINSDNTVISGHQRLNVLKDLGYTEVDVVVVDLDKPKEKALNIALNKITGEWDNDKLTTLLDELNASIADISVTGFDTAEIEALLSSESYISDLLNDDFVTANNDNHEFDVTFTFPIDYKENMIAYIKENGKQSIVDMIINRIKGLMLMPSCGSQAVLCNLPVRFDTYKGCSHLCRYCFTQRKADLNVIEKNEGAVALRNLIDGKRTEQTAWCDWNIPLHWGGLSDPFQPVELKHRVSYECLKIFAETQYPFVISTKGGVIIEPEYLDLLSKCFRQIKK